MEKYKKALKRIEQKLLEIELLKGLIIDISDDSKPRFKSVVKSSNFLYLAYRNAQRLLMLDICKVVDRKENSNLHSFIESLLTHYPKLIWHNTYSIDDLRNVKQQLDNVVSSNTYNRIKVSRDKYIAHDDKNKHNYESSIPFENLWEIISDLQSIYNKLSYPLFNYTVYFKFSHPPHELNHLHRYKLIQDIVMNKARNRDDLGPLEEILQIIIGPA